MKDFIKSINITTLEEAEELLKGGSDYDIFEKARAVGEFHANGKWVWTEYQPGKYDWRTAKKGGRARNKGTAEEKWKEFQTKSIDISGKYENTNELKYSAGKPTLSVDVGDPNERGRVSIDIPVDMHVNGKRISMERPSAYLEGAFDKKKAIFTVTKIHVDETLRKQGFATQLMEQAKAGLPEGYKIGMSGVFSDGGKGLNNKLIESGFFKPIEPKAIKFSRSRNVEEAEAWAKENLKHVGSADYSGISIGDANKVNKVLLDLQRQGVIKGDGTFNLVPFKGGKQGGVGGSYQMMKHGFNGADLKIDVKFETSTNSALRKAERYKEKIYEQRLKNTKDMISENIRLIEVFDNSAGGWENAGMYDRDRMLEQNKYLEKRLENFREIFEEENVGRYEVEFNTRARTMREALIHEYGHILNADMQMRGDKYPKEALDILLKIKKESGYRLDSPKLLFQPATNLFDERAKKYGMQVSHYASTCGAEYFAESFLMFNQGEKLPDEDLEKLFKILTK